MSCVSDKTVKAAMEKAIRTQVLAGLEPEIEKLASKELQKQLEILRPAVEKAVECEIKKHMPKLLKYLAKNAIREVWSNF